MSSLEFFCAAARAGLTEQSGWLTGTLTGTPARGLGHRPTVGYQRRGRSSIAKQAVRRGLFGIAAA
jgi:hypothetical protein